MKDRRFEVRLTEELYNTLEFKSKAVNMNKSEYILKSIINSDIKIDDSKDIRMLLASINRIGNNINQIAKNLNIANNINKLDDINCDNILDKLTIIEYNLKYILNGV